MGRVPTIRKFPRLPTIKMCQISRNHKRLDHNITVLDSGFLISSGWFSTKIPREGYTTARDTKTVYITNSFISKISPQSLKDLVITLGR